MDFRLEESLGFILNKTNTKLKNQLFQRFKEDDITPEQWSVLTCLWQQEGISPKELADLIYKDKPNTNRILEKLQAKGLILRKPHPIDRRAYQIYLTELGWAIKDKLIAKVTQLQDEVTAGMEQAQVEEMKRLLNQMYANLK
ncbi:MarR family winged helix-turn-helix transcriptional regulator [Paenibacillus mesotrionivorans]|jgi:DNA-binding MarR family transcriptional regulator|uniref:MarR family winged helix-turn-helix transcriptional regulator n=1 Tax=Paenibacillus mesotrionivorans TaxID=3160968 RepID=A0ACC7P1J0_9BACL